MDNKNNDHCFVIEGKSCMILKYTIIVFDSYNLDLI